MSNSDKDANVQCPERIATVKKCVYHWQRHQLTSAIAEMYQTLIKPLTYLMPELIATVTKCVSLTRTLAHPGINHCRNKIFNINKGTSLHHPMMNCYSNK